MTGAAFYPDRLITVSSREYLPGTQTMLHSFLQTHQGYSGDIVVLADDLSDDDQHQLALVFGGIEFRGPSDTLSAAIRKLVDAQPKLQGRARRFYSLDAFAPEQKGSTLFCDSDLLFRSHIGQMLKMDGPLIACGDRAQVTGSNRDPHSLAENNGPGGTARQNNEFASFNAGLMMIRPELRTPQNWAAMLGQLAPASWQDIASDHTDQAVYNRLFGTQVVLADISNNFLVGHGAIMRSLADASISAANVLHFNGPAKPWKFATHLDAAAADAGYIRAAQEWFHSYTGYLAALHFAARRTNR